jgi:hypothetical protein
MSERASARVIFENLNICLKGCAALRPAEKSERFSAGNGDQPKSSFLQTNPKVIENIESQAEITQGRTQWEPTRTQTPASAD